MLLSVPFSNMSYSQARLSFSVFAGIIVTAVDCRGKGKNSVLLVVGPAICGGKARTESVKYADVEGEYYLT
jgi:hypothetical protein